MSEDIRLKKIFQSSCKLFINKGFSNTKMKDIAHDAGISVGSMYDLFQNKDSLLNFIFLATLDDKIIYSAHDYPIQSIATEDLVQRTKKSYKKISTNINQNLINNQSYTLSQLVDDFFTIFTKYGQYFLILEKNPEINPELVSLYKDYRNDLYNKLEIYLKHSIKDKNIRPTINSSYDSMLIIDLIFWWSTHKKYDSFENFKNNYSISTMKKTISDLLSIGYQKR
ncbi:TetR/AcrR family transcriptional regulator [Companilactobacillus nuruki]|uniref:HTH tetR-type domain-containing protein n=1 Tax=Companilactobacillus nuruki TaxID=1993540 RepID=A0A2N7AVS8_9LACO|nr:TetR/AcrR family transcriptional regulator [Companilactobacillus nuruki]PMD72282.1 hypothetical protein CBP76_03860 [Companilactobacillus nuruki]